MILGSDLVYDATAMPSLARALQRLLRPQGTAHHAILASMRRQEATIEALEDALAAEKLTWEPLSASEEAFRRAQEWGEQGCDGPGDLLVMLVTGKWHC